MKIAVFLTSFHVGGVERVFITLLNKWAEQGHNVFAFVMHNEGEYLGVFDDRVTIVNLNCTNLWKTFFKVSSLLKHFKIEYFMVGKDMENVFFIFMKIFTRCKAKIVISQHNYFYLDKVGRKSLTAHFLPKFMKLLYRYSDLIVCVSKGIERYVKTLNVKTGQTAVIYNPMDMDEVILAGKELIKETGRFICFCGRLSAIKNVRLLIDGFDFFQKCNPDYKLLLIGGGDEEGLKKMVKDKKLSDKVIFVGSVSNPHCYVSKSEVLVLPSFSEAFPMVICEAFANGITVVSTPSGGPNELLAEGRGYLLSNFDDAQEMADAIENACKNPIPPHILQNYVKQFNSDDVAKQYTTAFGKL